MPTNAASFGDLLRRYRLAAGLSQEALAEQAKLSLDTVRALERGRSGAPRAETLTRLVAALGLEAETRAALVTAAWPEATSSAAGEHPAELPGSVAVVSVRRQSADHHLPVALSSFIGRERERTTVRELLERARLVTLTGAGGVGKTRLALAVAEELGAANRDGVWLVELAALADPDLVAGSTLRALGLREEPGQPALATLITFVQARQLLLVLDNCEHLLEPCAALVVALLHACPELRVLATSREALGVSGEQRYRVPSLSIPDSNQLASLELAPTYAAVRLFVERAQERQPEFSLLGSHLQRVAQICVRLDGIPLAIELAAARVGTLGLTTIEARLDRSLVLLTHGLHDQPSRQQTLRAALEWSWSLLAESERAVLRRLSVFANGWVLEAAEAVCADAAITAEEVLDLLESLANKSLLQVEQRAEMPRYRLLEMVRQFAKENMEATGEAAAVRARHATHYLDLAVKAETLLGGPEELRTQNHLEHELDNLRAALEWAFSQGNLELGAGIATALGWFWDGHGHLSEGRRYLDLVLAAGGTVPTVLRAMALNHSGLLAGRQGEYTRALQFLREGIAQCRDHGYRLGLAQGLNELGIVDLLQGHMEDATAALEEGRAVAHSVNAPLFAVMALGNLGALSLLQGDYVRATELLREAVIGARQLGGIRATSIGLVILGVAELFASSADVARPALEEGLRLSAVTGDRLFIMYAFIGLAGVAVAAELPYRAARILGAADGLAGTMRASIGPSPQALFEHIVRATRAQLGEEAYLKEHDEGLRLSLQQAIAYALGRDAFDEAS